MMLAGALLASNSAFAQNQSDATTGATQKAQSECCQAGKDGQCKGEKKGDKKGNKKGEKKGDKKGNKDRKREGSRPAYNPFDGVQLTADQQQRLQVLQEGLGPVQLTKEQQERIPENKNLTEEQKKQLKAERKNNKLEAKKKYLNGVKEILTPEQYVIFLENVYFYSPDAQGMNNGRAQGKKFPKADQLRKGSKTEKNSAK